ncbi:Protein of unknown function [Gryllus bimaculatus]|nr:Protein of unknown function [Gryllus bimaculatus]
MCFVDGIFRVKRFRLGAKEFERKGMELR